MSQTWTTIIQNVPKLFTELLCQRTDQRTLLWWRWDTEYNFIRWIKICFIFPSFFLFPKCAKSSGPIIEFGSFQVLDLRVKRWDLQISQPRFFICWTVSLFIHYLSCIPLKCGNFTVGFPKILNNNSYVPLRKDTSNHRHYSSQTT